MRIKADCNSELAHNKVDKLVVALTTRFCRAQTPPVWTPPAPHLRERRELARRFDALKITRVQELNRNTASCASPTVAACVAAHIAWLDQQIKAVMDAVSSLVAADPVLSKKLALLRGITGFGEISATILMTELSNIAEFTSKP